MIAAVGEEIGIVALGIIFINGDMMRQHPQLQQHLFI